MRSLRHLSNIPCTLSYIFIFLILLLYSSEIFAQKVIISEIMRDPIGSESAIPGGKSNEYVEITNFGPETLSLSDLFISNGVTVDSIRAFTEYKSENPKSLCNETILVPGKSAVILDQEYLFPQNIFRYPIASDAVILTVNHINLLDGITENDGVILFRGTRKSISEVVCAAIDSAIQPILSDKKLPLHSRSTVSEGTSIVPEFFLFSSYRYNAELSQHSLGYLSKQKGELYLEYRCIDTSGGSVVCSLAIRCTDGNALGHIQYEITSVSDTTFKYDTLLTNQDTGTLFLFLKLPQQRTLYQFSVTSGLDSASLAIDIGAFSRSLPLLCITQISPRSTQTAPEWFECFNRGSSTVNIRNWFIFTQSDSIRITDVDVFIEPGTFYVFSQDSLRMRNAFTGIPFRCVQISPWLTLNNYHDTLTIKNTNYQSITSAAYASRWYQNWESQTLARPCNSCTSADSLAFVLTSQPLPGIPSKPPPINVQPYSLTIGPRPFSPNADNHDDQLSIRLSIPAFSRVQVRILAMNGLILREFNDCQSGVFSWDGKTTSGNPAPLGPFFVVARALNNSQAPLLRTKGILWR
jgi:hypothetical protein